MLLFKLHEKFPNNLWVVIQIPDYQLQNKTICRIKGYDDVAIIHLSKSVSKINLLKRIIFMYDITLQTAEM